MDIIEINQNENATEPEIKNEGSPATSNGDKKNKPERFAKIRKYFREHKKMKWLVIILLIVIIVTAIWFGLQMKNNKSAADKANPPSTDLTGDAVKVATVASPLTGLQVSEDAAKQPIVGVMIENHFPDARPQSGLSAAGAVYEAFAEGGITRFLAVFQQPLPDSIGPVRSLRPYFLRWGLEYNIPIAHAGGSQPALADIGTLGMKNIEALAYGSSYFFRASDRPSPHNLYTNNSKLTALVSKLGFDKAPTFTPLTRKEDTAPVTAANPDIKITYGNASYNVEWKYDASNNNYGRSQGGTVQNDRNNSAQLTAKNVVVMFTPTSYGTQPDGKPETIMNLVGTGNAVVFIDGGATVATWSKASNSAQTKFADSAGAEIKFNAGNIWYEVVPVGNAVTY
ncbi:hypothetical protein COT78_01075 [Candidatus Berkelbacteria bacterium CG10_big_fil_rev_8_21_14_0_10_43_13]|uniref:DUF3048 domain-containing protein n=1 Tax=Candidatus Berkelbacteria bacterium CG10_big_fil_rev_8_21_14_0_10_43_13 TaxID=1974514 RepID=A0A2H0W763_9BACT|nr:MAG: hypothetical protein COT78_01075 [Candidatus Berkelbacteria bacterium CG10_big_fil_rev_8_21_14_0_10_43_13]